MGLSLMITSLKYAYETSECMKKLFKYYTTYIKNNSPSFYVDIL